MSKSSCDFLRVRPGLIDPRAAGRTSAFDFDLAIEFASPDNVTPRFGAPLLPAAPPPLASPGRECDGDDVHARSLRSACESAPRAESAGDGDVAWRSARRDDASAAGAATEPPGRGGDAVSAGGVPYPPRPSLAPARIGLGSPASEKAPSTESPDGRFPRFATSGDSREKEPCEPRDTPGLCVADGGGAPCGPPNDVGSCAAGVVPVDVTVVSVEPGVNFPSRAVNESGELSTLEAPQPMV